MTLLESVRRYSDVHADRFGNSATPIPGLTTIRMTQPGEIQCAINKPLVALVVQGRKRVAMGSKTFDFGAGDSLLITADIPTTSEITAASRGEPYYSFVFELDLGIIRDLTLAMGPAPAVGAAPIHVDPTEAEVADMAARMMALIERPAALPVLAEQHRREMHYWLLAGRHGGGIRALGMVDSQAERIARAVALIREHYRQPLRVHDLADVAGMSISTFHQHFRAVTTLSPLQFQKQLRLIEARRQMVALGVSPGVAAYAVGYESVTQFTREYARRFGLPPARDVRALVDGHVDAA